MGKEYRRILIVVDVQKDFCPGGSLGVPGGDEIVPLINRLAYKLDAVIATADMHPSDHCSFKENGGPWPTHCVMDTPGSDLHQDLPEPLFTIYKGTTRGYDSYSGFKDDGGHETSMRRILMDVGAEELYICGLATDYCVKATALDAVKAGYNTYVVADACRAVDLEEGDEQKALCEMEEAGIMIVQAEDVG